MGVLPEIMPVVDLVHYCAACDEGRAKLAEAADSNEARMAVLREHPRRLATKTDIDGTPVCARCLEGLAQHRKANYYFEHSGTPRESVF
jgi:hypothetical protein